MLTEAQFSVGIPRMEELGPAIAVPFATRRLARARVLWINLRWFADRGVDLHVPAARVAIEEWLLDQFAFAVPGPGDPPEAFLAQSKCFHADRYGATGGSRHGGSGRAGFHGTFNAKGIGRTPLASDATDWWHSHGCLWLDEAIREAINGEVAAAEFPAGAIPVVAILDLGLSGLPTPEGQPARRAMVVRPNFVRPAHMERSVFFGGAGTADSDQHLDALRTRDAVEALSDPEVRQRGHFPYEGLSTFFATAARQVGHGWAHRLWQGQCLTQNLSIDGALVDFGAFRAAPSWRRAVGRPGEIFGTEAWQLSGAVASLCHFERKYAPVATCPTAETILRGRIADDAIAGFEEGCLAGLRLSPGQAGVPNLLAALKGYFRHQQRETIRIGFHKTGWRKPWLADLLRGAEAPEDERLACRPVLAAMAAVGAGSRQQADAIAQAARLWLTPRPLLYYSLSTRSAQRLCRQLTDGTSDRDLVAQYIERVVSASRRLWSHYPLDMFLNAQSTDLACTALYGLSGQITGSTAVVDAPVFGDYARIFGAKIPLEDLQNSDHIVRDGRVSFILPSNGGLIKIGKTIIHPKYIFPAPDIDNINLNIAA